MILTIQSPAQKVNRDGREAERGVASTKGSVNLNDYIGAEVGFNLDKEANTIALIFREMIHILALDDRETLMKWQVSSEELRNLRLLVPTNIIPTHHDIRCLLGAPE